jgi:hypothetical protein
MGGASVDQVYQIVPGSAKSCQSAQGVGVVFLALAAVFPAVRLAAAAVGPLVGAAAMFYVAWSMRHAEFTLTAEDLKIKGDLFGRTIPRVSLVVQEARVVSLEQETDYQPMWRIAGTAWPGYLSGWFRLRNRTKCLVFVTDRTQVVHVPTTLGYSLLLSVDQPGAFLQALTRE